jgi:hypothetical protein
MNKHFRDARYYLGRAVDHTVEGLREEFGPVVAQARERLGIEREVEPEPTRVERIQSELREIESRASGKSREAVANARQQLRKYRSSGTEIEVDEAPE